MYKEYEYIGNAYTNEWSNLFGCTCGATLKGKINSQTFGVEFPVQCIICAKEMAVTLGNNLFASVRLPYGCSEWSSLESSNLNAAGIVKDDLIIRFNNGAIYIYPCVSHLFQPLLKSDSKGKFFCAKIRQLIYSRLCNVYGCMNDKISKKLKICEKHSSF